MSALDVIEVLCIVMPDGATFWCETDRTDPSYEPRRVTEAWKAQLSPEKRERYEQADCMGGFVWCVMLREDYERIPATNLSAQVFEQPKCT